MFVNNIIDKLSELKLKPQPSTDSASHLKEVNQTNQFLPQNNITNILNYPIEKFQIL